MTLHFVKYFVPLMQLCIRTSADQTVNFFTSYPSIGSSQTGYGNFQSVYCGGFLNNHPAATTDAKIKGKEVLKNIILLFNLLFQIF